MCCCSCCGWRLLCSQIWGITKGLLLTVAYDLIGWFLFTYVEENTNPIQCFIDAEKTIADEKKRATIFFQQLQNKTSQNLTKNQTTAMYSIFEKHFNTPTPSLPVYPVDLCTKWLYFSMMTLTTIGYGAVTPKTSTGKLLLIPYALIGIPLTLAYLAYVGSVISDWVERTMMCIHRIIKGNRPIRYKSLKRSFYLFLGTWIVIIVSLLKFLPSSKTSWLDLIYFFIVTYTTVGFGDITWPTAALESYAIELIFGLSIVSALVNSILDLRKRIRLGNGGCKLLCCSYIEEENSTEHESDEDILDTHL